MPWLVWQRPVKRQIEGVDQSHGSFEVAAEIDCRSHLMRGSARSSNPIVGGFGRSVSLKSGPPKGFLMGDRTPSRHEMNFPAGRPDQARYRSLQARMQALRGARTGERHEPRGIEHSSGSSNGSADTDSHLNRGTAPLATACHDRSSVRLSETTGLVLRRTSSSRNVLGDRCEGGSIRGQLRSRPVIDDARDVPLEEQEGHRQCERCDTEQNGHGASILMVADAWSVTPPNNLPTKGTVRRGV